MSAIGRSSTALEVIRGVPNAYPVQMLNPPPPAGNGQPRDLTGCTVDAQMLSDRITKTFGVSFVDRTQGKFTFSITAEQAADLPKTEFNPRAVLTVTDPQGGVVLIVYPLVGVSP